MKTRYLALCPSCHEFFAPQKDPCTVSCPECGCMLKPVDYDLQTYSALNEDEKKQFKQKYVAQHFPKPFQKPFKPMPVSGWVGFVSFCGWFSIVVLLITCVFSFISGNFALSVLCLIAAPISGGGLILFAIAAEDVRHIRNQVDKLHHLQNQSK